MVEALGAACAAAADHKSYVSTYGAEVTVLSYKCGRYEPKEEGAWSSSHICHMIKVPKDDEPGWRKTREPEFMRSFWRAVRDVNAAGQHDKGSTLRLGSEDRLRSARLSPAW